MLFASLLFPFRPVSKMVKRSEKGFSTPTILRPEASREGRRSLSNHGVRACHHHHTQVIFCLSSKLIYLFILLGISSAVVSPSTSSTNGSVTDVYNTYAPIEIVS